MLIPREELRYDFGGAKFDLKAEADRKILAWVFNQFLYGEVTGIQCGYWLYRAPHLNAAAFLAKQAGEEISHVKRILRILSVLGEKPAPAHGAVRFLSTGMMGGNWGEHVALEMALGEGLVLSVFYAMADTIAEPEIHKIIESALKEEESHVEFGERETLAWLAAHPGDRKILLASALFQVAALKRLREFTLKRMIRMVGPDHPVLSQFGAFYDHTLRMFETRIERLGISDRPLTKLSALTRVGLVSSLPFRKAAARVIRRDRLLTSTYLADPIVEAEAKRTR